jgi:hypothetical protein
MAMTPYSGDTAIIGALGTNPEERGLNTQEFKDKFDEALTAFVAWFNATHVPEIDSYGADKQSLYRQALINGNFDVWQRGTNFNTPVSGTYLADRWCIAYDGTGSTFTISQQAFTPGQTSVPNNPRYFLRWAQTVAGSGGAYKNIYQRIEDVNNFEGQQITVSFWAKADAARSISVIPSQYFGSGGSATTYMGPQAINLTTSWQKFTATFNVPSINGKTLGSGHCLDINFGLPVNTTMTIDIAQVQVNAGSIALPFQPKSFAEELRACLRYYEKSFPYGTAPAQNVGSALGAPWWQQITAGATQTALHIPFKERKRTAPTLTLYNPVAANAQVRNFTLNADCTSSTTINNPGDSGFTITATNTAGAAAGNSNSVHWAADAEL